MIKEKVLRGGERELKIRKFQDLRVSLEAKLGQISIVNHLQWVGVECGSRTLREFIRLCDRMILLKTITGKSGQRRHLSICLGNNIQARPVITEIYFLRTRQLPFPVTRFGFLWAMTAHGEQVDRQFRVENVQPGFNQSGSGLGASRRLRSGT
jgi:hypothetical protein